LIRPNLILTILSYQIEMTHHLQGYVYLLDEDKAYKCYMTEEELEKEREDQIARGEMPRYGRSITFVFID
jgi:glutamyl/glutaminyl-tRNA synthetase